MYVFRSFRVAAHMRKVSGVLSRGDPAKRSRVSAQSVLQTSSCVSIPLVWIEWWAAPGAFPALKDSNPLVSCSGR